MCIVLVVLSFTAYSASFQCESVWSGPSAGNSLSTCLFSVTQVFGNKAAIAAVASLGVLAVLSALIFPGLCVYQTFCDVCHVRNTAELRRGSRCSKVAAVVALMIAIGIFIVALLGTGRSVTALLQILASISSLNTRLAEIPSLVQLRLSNSTGLVALAQSSTLASLTSAVTAYTSQTGGAIAGVVQYRNAVVYSVNAFVAVPMLLFVVLLGYVAWDVSNRCVLVVSAVLFWILSFVFLAVAAVALVISVGAEGICVERELYRRGEPGVGRWLMVPLCERDLTVNATLADIDRVVVGNAERACASLLDICDGSPSTTSRPFFCPTLAAKGGAVCVDGNVSASFLQNTTQKATAAPCGGGAAGMSSSSPRCTVNECPARCNATAVRNAAARAVAASDAAGSAGVARGIVAPLADCVALVDAFAATLAPCGVIGTGMLMSGIALALAFGLTSGGVCLLFRGPHHFYKDKSHKSESPRREPLS